MKTERWGPLVTHLADGTRDTTMRGTIEITPELEAWLLEAVGKPASALSPSDFEAIRERVRARLKSSIA